MSDQGQHYPIVRLRERVNLLREITGGSRSCGWMFDETAFLLYGLVKFYKPQLVIQTGHLWGKSALFVLEALNDGLFTHNFLEEKEQSADARFTRFVISHKPLVYSSQFISIDPNPIDVPDWRKGIEQLRDWYDNFAFYEMTSDEFFHENQEWLRSKSSGSRIMGIVDGDHSPQGCLNDLDNLGELNAGLIIVDDTIWLPQLGKVAKQFASSRGYQFLDFAFYNGVAILVGRSGFESKLDQMAISALGTGWGSKAIALKRNPLGAISFLLTKIRRFRK